LPPQARWRASAASTRATSITFRNRHDRPVRLFWVDGEGLPRSYGELAAGAERSQATFVGHVRLADFAADDLAGVFVAAPSPGLATFDAESQTAAMARAATSPARLQAEVTIREPTIPTSHRRTGRLQGTRCSASRSSEVRTGWCT
jgi:hypothetical protein